MKHQLLLILSVFSVHNSFASDLFDTERVATISRLMQILESYPNLVQLHIADRVSKKLTDTYLKEISMKYRAAQENNFRQKNQDRYPCQQKYIFTVKNPSHR